jgi:Uma2 family endonuclease
MSTVATPLPVPPLPAAPSEIASIDDALYEIIDGQRVELPPMSVYALVVANRLAYRLNVAAAAQDIGAAYVETLFNLPLPVERKRRFDVAYVSYQRWPKDRPVPLAGNAWDVVPDIAVEVSSPSDLADDLISRVPEYFRAGVRLVWLVFPPTAQVFVFETPTQVRVVQRDQQLDGGIVLPSFRVALAEVFPAVAS